MRTRRMRRGEIDLIKIGIGLSVVVGLYFGIMLVPHYWAYWKMEEVVQVSTLAWRDHSLPRAQERLVKELDDKNIPTYVLVEDCSFYEEMDDRVVECDWAIDVNYPLVKKSKRLEFWVCRYLTPDDQLHDCEGED